MAAKNTIATTRSIANGGIITIDGDDIDNIQYGTIRFRDVFRPPIQFSSGGTNQQSLEGNPQRGMLEFDLKAGSLTTNSAYLALMTRNSPVDGLVNEFTVVVKIPSYQGATAGESITITTFELSEPVELQAGGPGQLDSLRVRGTFRSAATIATY